MTTSRIRTLTLALCLAACGGAQKPAAPAPGKTGGDAKASNDFGDPADTVNGNDNRPRPPSPEPAGPAGSSSQSASRSPAGGGGGEPSAPGAAADPGADRDRAGGAEAAATPQVTMPNYDPDPAQARAQVEQHLQVARQALAGQLGFAVRAERIRRIVLGIRSALAAIEHVVGRKVHEGGAEALADRGERADGVAIERERCAGLVLCAVDQIPRRRVDDVSRSQRGERLCRPRCIENVDVAVREWHRHAGAGEGFHEIGAELTGGADDDVARRLRHCGGEAPSAIGLRV